MSKLKSELSHQNQIRKADAMRLMQENVGLIKEITKMRREIKLHNQLQRQRDSSSVPAVPASAGDEEKVAEDELRKLAEMQRQQIEQLRAQLEAAQQRRISSSRPISRDRYTLTASRRLIEN